MRPLLLCTLAALAALVAPAAAAAPRPDVIPLPAGFGPEGIDIRGDAFYVGSIPTGAVLRGSLRTGAGAVLVPARAGRAAIGLKVDGRRLFVAGGPTGQAFVYDARTGADLRTYTLASGPTFINDVTVTPRGAYFTDSQQPVLRVLRLGPGGRLPAAATDLPLTGDLAYDDDPSTFELNGIASTPSGRTLVAVQSAAGALFRIDPRTGATDRIELAGGATVADGDGLLLRGRTLYVVQNRLNRIAVVRLSARLTSGRVVRTITDADFAIPTTVARRGGSLYLPNAKFGTPPTPTTPYEVVRVPAFG